MIDPDDLRSALDDCHTVEGRDVLTIRRDGVLVCRVSRWRGVAMTPVDARWLAEGGLAALREAGVDIRRYESILE